MAKKDRAAAPPAEPKDEPAKKSKDASLNGKKFDLTESERDSCAQILEKAASLRQQSEQLESGAYMKARKYVLERIGASPDEVARAQVQVHRAGGIVVAVEITDADPPQAVPAAPPPPAPELKTLKTLKGGKKAKKGPPEPAPVVDVGLRASRARQRGAPVVPLA